MDKLCTHQLTLDLLLLTCVTKALDLIAVIYQEPVEQMVPVCKVFGMEHLQLVKVYDQ